MSEPIDVNFKADQLDLNITPVADINVDLTSPGINIDIETPNTTIDITAPQTNVTFIDNGQVIDLKTEQLDVNFDGVGDQGPRGFQGAGYVKIFRREANIPATPTGGTYDFISGDLNAPNGWTKTPINNELQLWESEAKVNQALISGPIPGQKEVQELNFTGSKTNTRNIIPGRNEFAKIGINQNASTPVNFAGTNEIESITVNGTRSNRLIPSTPAVNSTLEILMKSDAVSGQTQTPTIFTNLQLNTTYRVEMTISGGLNDTSSSESSLGFYLNNTFLNSSLTTDNTLSTFYSGSINTDLNLAEAIGNINDTTGTTRVSNFNYSGTTATFDLIIGSNTDLTKWNTLAGGSGQLYVYGNNAARVLKRVDNSNLQFSTGTTTISAQYNISLLNSISYTTGTTSFTDNSNADSMITQMANNLINSPNISWDSIISNKTVDGVIYRRALLETNVTGTIQVNDFLIQNDGANINFSFSGTTSITGTADNPGINIASNYSIFYNSQVLATVSGQVNNIGDNNVVSIMNNLVNGFNNNNTEWTASIISNTIRFTANTVGPKTDSFFISSNNLGQTTDAGNITFNNSQLLVLGVRAIVQPTFNYTNSQIGSNNETFPANSNEKELTDFIASRILSYNTGYTWDNTYNIENGFRYINIDLGTENNVTQSLSITPNDGNNLNATDYSLVEVDGIATTTPVLGTTITVTDPFGTQTTQISLSNGILSEVLNLIKTAIEADTQSPVRFDVQIISNKLILTSRTNNYVAGTWVITVSNNGVTGNEAGDINAGDVTITREGRPETQLEELEWAIPFQSGGIGPKGDKGDAGETGQTGTGIKSITATSTTDTNRNTLVKVTETLTDDSTNDFNFTVNKGDKGDQGNQGSTGNKGNTGDTGPSNILTVASTTTSVAGGNAQVSITGTSPSQALAFTIPRGSKGTKGDKGLTGNTGPSNILSVESTNTTAPGTNAAVTVNGTSPSQKLVFDIPRGATGNTGNSGKDGTDGKDGISITTVTATSSNDTNGNTDVTITELLSDGTTPNFTFKVLKGSKGDTGNAGPANILNIGTVNQGTAAASITGTSPSQILNLTLPKGADGISPSITGYDVDSSTYYPTIETSNGNFQADVSVRGPIGIQGTKGDIGISLTGFNVTDKELLPNGDLRVQITETFSDNNTDVITLDIPKGATGPVTQAWYPETEYRVGNIVTYLEKIYISLTTHKSDLTFDDTKWVEYFVQFEIKDLNSKFNLINTYEPDQNVYIVKGDLITSYKALQDVPAGEDPSINPKKEILATKEIQTISMTGTRSNVLGPFGSNEFLRVSVLDSAISGLGDSEITDSSLITQDTNYKIEFELPSSLTNSGVEGQFWSLTSINIQGSFFTLNTGNVQINSIQDFKSAWSSGTDISSPQVVTNLSTQGNMLKADIIATDGNQLGRLKGFLDTGFRISVATGTQQVVLLNTSVRIFNNITNGTFSIDPDINNTIYTSSVPTTTLNNNLNASGIVTQYATTLTNLETNIVSDLIINSTASIETYSNVTDADGGIMKYDSSVSYIEMGNQINELILIKENNGSIASTDWNTALPSGSKIKLADGNIYIIDAFQYHIANSKVVFTTTSEISSGNSSNSNITYESSVIEGTKYINIDMGTKTNISSSIFTQNNSSTNIQPTLLETDGVETSGNQILTTYSAIDTSGNQAISFTSSVSNASNSDFDFVKNTFLNTVNNNIENINFTATYSNNLFTLTSDDNISPPQLWSFTLNNNDVTGLDTGNIVLGNTIQTQAGKPYNISPYWSKLITSPSITIFRCNPPELNLIPGLIWNRRFTYSSNLRIGNDQQQTWLELVPGLKSVRLDSQGTTTQRANYLILDAQTLINRDQLDSVDANLGR